MENLTHWKKLTNPDYLGAYALLPGEEIIVTIKDFKQENVTGTGGTKEMKTVVTFAENVKPMVLNRTNAKTITKLCKKRRILKKTIHKLERLEVHSK